VGGEPLWFEAEGFELLPSPEAYANALLVPAMQQGFHLEFQDSLCPQWLENAHALMRIYQEWYDWDPIAIRCAVGPPVDQRSNDKVALCFSGGADSFHSLLTYPKNISYLAMVHGYDIALSDTAGAEIVFKHIQQVADEVGVSAVKISTNYREHTIAGRKYRYAYEGALASIGFLMADANELVISSDYSREALLDFNAASHWKTGPLRSSADVQIVHYGDAYTRDEKLRQIAQNPLVRKHLRVCQENLKPAFDFSSSDLNCGSCDKCLRTIIPLMQSGGLDGVEVFYSTDRLSIKVDKLNVVPAYASFTYGKFLTLGVSDELAHSIRALMFRSEFIHKRQWLGRRGIKCVGWCLRKLKQLRGR
jgi:hypothetical protein